MLPSVILGSGDHHFGPIAKFLVFSLARVRRSAACCYRPRRMLIVDVYNVLHITGVLPAHLAGLDVGGLADLVALSRYGKQKSLLVCDGFGSPTADDATAHAILRGREPSAADFQGILFAGRGRDADSLIEVLLARFGGTRSITVASSDRRVGRAARGVKSRWIRSDDFLRELVADVDRSGSAFRTLRPAFANDLPLTPGETDRWMREFGIEPDAAASNVQPVPPPIVVKPANGAKAKTEPAATPPVKPLAKPVVKPPMTAKPEAANDKPAIDPLLVQALRMWPGRISLDELDMEWWLDNGGQDVEAEKYR